MSKYCHNFMSSCPIYINFNALRSRASNAFDAHTNSDIFKSSVLDLHHKIDIYYIINNMSSTCPNPALYPQIICTRSCGYGISWIRVRVGEFNPR